MASMNYKKFMGCTIVFQIIRCSSILHHRSIYQKHIGYFTNRLFSDLLYKESFDIIIKWHPNSATFFIT